MIIYTLSLDSRGFRVPLKVKVAASSRTPASHRPGVCVHMHTRVCTHTCIHHSKISGGRKEKRKGRRTNSLCQPPPPSWPGGIFGSGLADTAAQQRSLEASGQLPLLSRPQALPTVFKAGELRWQVATGCGGTGVSDTKADTWWWPVRASEVVGMRDSRRQLERGPESCGLCRTSASSLPAEVQSSPSPSWQAYSIRPASTKRQSPQTK